MIYSVQTISNPTKLANFLLSLLLCWGMSSQQSRAQPKTKQEAFAECHKQFAVNPDIWQSSDCFYQLRLTHGSEVEVAQVLRDLIAKHPDKGWLHFNLGRIAFDRGEPEATTAFENAALLFAEHRDLSGEFYSRLNLYKWFVRFEDIKEAEAQLEAVGAAVANSDDTNLQAQYQLHVATHEIQIGQDYEAAHHSLLKTEAVAFPDGPYSLKRDCLSSLGGVSIRLGRNERASHYYQRLADLARKKEDLPQVANAKLHQLMTLALAEEQLKKNRDEAVHLAREVVAIAEQVDRLEILAEAYQLQGQFEPAPQNIAILEKGVMTARKLGEPLILAECLGSLARAVAATSPERANQLIQEAYTHVVDSEQPWSIMIWLFNRMRVHYQTYPADLALDRAFSALEFLESSRGSHFTESSRIGLLSVWSEMYYWLSGMLLKDLPLGQRTSIEQSFSVMERMRARSLLDALHRDDDFSPEDLKEIYAIRGQITQLNRKLFDGNLSAEDRGKLLTQLDDLELTFETAKNKSLSSEPAPQLDFPKLLDIEQSLKPDQAVLAFQISETENIFGDIIGGSWLLVITSQGTKRYRMPDRQRLAPAVRTYLGLMADTDHQDIFKQVSANLYKRLLGQALGELDTNIHKLIVLPDGPLHRLPFSSLYATPKALPLASRFQLSRIPSATVWWHLQGRKPAETAHGALVFADPELPSTSESTQEPSLRSWTLAGGSHLDPLPLSRKEGADVAAQMGSSSQVFFGPDASEFQLKTMDLSGQQVLHFAAHAMVDESSPQRSAVVLSQGDEKEDGLLQTGEIETLSLQGQIVVLSTCSSASGQILRGEGAMSLARGFLKAGASVVVATLQPLRDDHGSFFFNHFYRALAKGETVATAIQSAQKACIDADLPPSSWAPVVAICRDEVRLNVAASFPTNGLLVGASLILILCLLWAWWPRSSPSEQ